MTKRVTITTQVAQVERLASRCAFRGSGLFALGQTFLNLFTVFLAVALSGGCVQIQEPKMHSSPLIEKHVQPLDIFNKRMGLFIHWVASTPEHGSGILFSDGRASKTPDEFADTVDVPKVCDEIAALGFEYVVLTDFHGFGTMLHPSKASDTWRGPGFTARRDVVGEMIAALKARGIAVILFTHPLDGHDFSPEQKKLLGWNDPEGGYKRWNDFVNDVYAELTERYGKNILGIGFDSEFALSENAEWKGKLDRDRLRQTILSRQPDLSLIALTGPNETCELGMKELWRPSWLDPWMSRPEDDYNVETWPAYKRCIAIVQGHHWATITPPEGGQARLTSEQMYRYTVLQAGTATEGAGTCWAASPYTDGRWEKGVREAFTKLAGYMAPVGASLRNVYASLSYPTPEGSTLSGLPHGVVATRQTDDTVEYLHVLNPPAGHTLALPAPADGKRFTAAALLADGTAVELTQDDAGLKLTLPEGKAWHPLNTVIRLQVDPATMAPRNLALHRPVFASTSIERDPQWPPRSDSGRIRLVDGQTRVTPRPNLDKQGRGYPFNWSTGNAGWSSARSEQSCEQHVGVDLGDAVLIGEVRLYPRDDGEPAGQGFPLDFQIQCSVDGRTWSTLVTQTDYPLPKDMQRFSVKPQKARYVRVLATRLRANPADNGFYSFQLTELAVLAP